MVVPRHGARPESALIMNSVGALTRGRCSAGSSPGERVPFRTMIRLLGESDAFELRTLRLHALRDAPDAFLSTYEAEAGESESVTAERLRRTANAKDSGVLGAFEDGALVGMLGIVRETQRKASHRAHLWGMYVAPDARKRGIG